MTFYQARNKADAIQARGSDWAKIVKTAGGFLFFETVAEYRAWKLRNLPRP